MQDEDIYAVFANDNPELSVEAIRLPRDPKTSIGKGFGFVLFKTKVRSKRLDLDSHFFWTSFSSTTNHLAYQPPRDDIGSRCS